MEAIVGAMFSWLPAPSGSGVRNNQPWALPRLAATVGGELMADRWSELDRDDDEKKTVKDQGVVEPD